jgi:hypothetical protein
VHDDGFREIWSSIRYLIKNQCGTWPPNSAEPGSSLAPRCSAVLLNLLSVVPPVRPAAMVERVQDIRQVVTECVQGVALVLLILHPRG